MSNSEDFQTRYLGKWYYSPDWELAKHIKNYQEKEMKLIGVSGFDMEKLIELFAAGYRLVAPEYERDLMSRQEVLRVLTEKGD